MSKRVPGISVYRPIAYGNIAEWIPPEERKPGSDHTHRWTIAVRSAGQLYVEKARSKKKGDARKGDTGDDLAPLIKKVTFKLHETYPSPTRTVEQPPFELTETGWGEFDIVIRIFFANEANEKPVTLQHHLRLHPWISADLTPRNDPATAASSEVVNVGDLSRRGILPNDDTPISPNISSWQYDELVFSEPTEAFYSILLANPPTPLPRSIKMGPIIPGTSSAPITHKLERAEADFLDDQRRALLADLDTLRQRLIQTERDIATAKAALDV